MATRAIHPANHAVDVAAAAVPAIAAGWAAARLANLADAPVAVAMATASLLVFLLAYGVMRRSGAATADFRVATFVPPPMEDTDRAETAVSGEVLLLDIPYRAPTPELLLDTVWDEQLLDSPAATAPDELLLDRPLLDRQVDELAELLLDDPLQAMATDSRVVRLFAPQPMPTAGQLADRIERHLGYATEEAPNRDGHDALREALDELRRSLRRA